MSNTNLNSDKVNKHGLRYSHIRGRLKRISIDIPDARPDEVVRYLVKLAFEIDPQITVTCAEKLNIDNT